MPYEDAKYCLVEALKLDSFNCCTIYERYTTKNLASGTMTNDSLILHFLLQTDLGPAVEILLGIL